MRDYIIKLVLFWGAMVPSYYVTKMVVHRHLAKRSQYIYFFDNEK